MPLISKRPRISLSLAIFVYLLIAFSVSDVSSLEAVRESPCPAALLREGADPDSGITVLQGNAWMLPGRPLLLPYAFSTDRRERLGLLVRTIRSCSPDVVVLQEVFERPMVDLLARSLPGYGVHTSGETDFTGTVNASGLVTLTRLPGGGATFHPFPPLPAEAKAIERMGRKGFLVVDVDVRGFRGSVVNLHLYAARGDHDASFTLTQLRRVMDFAEGERRAGRALVMAGDFNVDRPRLDRLLRGRWDLSRHGATYDPAGNPYTVEGSNNTRENHDERRLGRGVKTVDFLVVPGGSGMGVRSSVLSGLPLSDHYFLQHRVAVQEP